MKANTIIYVLAILTLFFAGPGQVKAQASASKEKHSNMLVGTWKVDTIMTRIQLLDAYREEYLKKYKELKEQTEFIFSENGRYEKKSPTAPRKGRWEISDDGRFIIIRFDNSEEESRTRIKEITNNRLDMVPASENASNSEVILYKTN